MSGEAQASPEQRREWAENRAKFWRERSHAHARRIHTLECRLHEAERLLMLATDDQTAFRAAMAQRGAV